jgi:hypothetical protein
MGNQNPQAEEGQTTHRPKEEGQTTHRPKRDRQHTGRMKKDNGKNNNLQNTRKLKISLLFSQVLWFSLSNKTDHHFITGIFLKVTFKSHISNTLLCLLDNMTLN